jgi:hypothetical protein
MTGTDRDAAFRDQHPEPRNLESVSIELHRRLEGASRALEMLKTQQATCNSLVHQVQSDLDAAVAVGRQMKEAIEQKAEEPSGVVATLQAAVEKTRETVIGQVEHVREQAVAAFHRIKGEGSRVENGGQENSPSAKGSGRRDIG